MRSRRGSRSVLLGAALLLLAAASAFVAAPAGAQTTCQASATYNPSAVIGANPVSATQGQSVTVTGTGFAPNLSVTVTLMGQTMTVVTDASGAFSAVFSTTGVAPGSYTATAVQCALTLSTNVSVLGAAVTPVTTVTPVATGTLPTTGSSSTTPMVSAGLGLLAVGGMLVLFARKRRGLDPVS